MHYTVYKITNQIDGKIYIGCHKTDQLDDGYMGSGVYLNHAIKKHGIENFEKEILQVYDNPEDMYLMESMLVNHEAPETYNLKKGGCGGFDHIHDSDFYGSEEHIKISKSGFNAYEKKYGVGSFLSCGIAAMKEKYGDDYLSVISKRGTKALKKKYPNGTWKDRKHKGSSKRKASAAMKGRFMGKDNSQYGTMWITNGVDSKKIKGTDPIPDGWWAGRKQKKK